jgi:6,7-dimethyl-8-ribityllumazine synthase
MAKVIEGNMLVKGKKFGIIASRFNDFMTKQLVAGCVDTLVRHGADDNDLTIAWVPGAFEIPVIAGKMVKSEAYDAVICLGTVIRGQTPHFEFVAAEASKGIAKVAQESDIPVIFGIITADTIEQAVERSGTKDGNKGRDAALSAIEMINVMAQIK